MPPTHIAILGGGLTGLSSAFHLSRRFPTVRVTIVEKASTLGGWARSNRVSVRSGDTEASVLLEAGPRTLRPNGLAMLELINLLNLNSAVLAVPRSSPAARHRFLHLPGTHGLTCIPDSLPALLTSPLAGVLIPAVLRDAVRVANRPETTPRAGDEYADLDESVDSFFTRRFGPDFARICGSAIVHGVYAADSRKLSVRAAVPFLHDLEISGRGSVVRGALWGALKKVFSQGGRKAEDFKEVQYDLGDVRRLMKDVSVYSFREGMGMLVSALEGALNQRDNVRIVKGDAVVGLRRRASEEQGFEVATASGMTIAPSHLVSSLPLPNLYALLQRSLSSPTSSSSAPLAVLPHLTANPSSSVTVVNLVFPSPPGARPLHPPGFGYLVPRPAAGYSTDGKYESRPDNPMGVLGTVFDSCALAEQDTDSAGRPAPVTKMTVMLGGPYSSSPEPDVDSLLHHLSVHLSPSPSPEPLGAPLIAQIHRHTSCIPTPTVGHVARMAELREAVRREWGGCAEVIGAGVGGVSVNACAEMGKTVGKDW